MEEHFPLPSQKLWDGLELTRHVLEAYCCHSIWQVTFEKRASLMVSIWKEEGKEKSLSPGMGIIAENLQRINLVNWVCH